jgi:lysophospholipase L1-like esterase
MRRKTKKRLGVVAVAVLAVGAAYVTASAVMTSQAPPPAPSIDLAKASQAAESAKAERAASDRAALEAATVPLNFPASGPLRVLFSGDSLSEGYFTTAPEKGFRPLVTAALAKSGPIEEVGAYKAGATVQYITDKFPAPENIGLAVVELGTNDSRVEGQAPAFRERYRAYLAGLKAKSPNMQLLCVGAWVPVNQRTIPYNDAIREECAKNGGRFVDLSNIYPITSMRGPEGVQTWGGLTDLGHPNDTGHERIAAAILDKIRR